METVGLQRFSLHSIRLTPIESVQTEAIFRVMGQLTFSQMHKPPAARHGIHVHFILKPVFSPLNLGANLLAFPFKPVRDMVEFCFSIQRLQISIFIPVPAFPAELWMFRSRFRIRHILPLPFSVLSAHPQNPDTARETDAPPLSPGDPTANAM